MAEPIDEEYYGYEVFRVFFVVYSLYIALWVQNNGLVMDEQLKHTGHHPTRTVILVILLFIFSDFAGLRNLADNNNVVHRTICQMTIHGFLVYFLHKITGHAHLIPEEM